MKLSPRLQRIRSRTFRIGLSEERRLQIIVPSRRVLFEG
jgi:hypothetical protein